jgi:hypothetical protein
MGSTAHLGAILAPSNGIPCADAELHIVACEEVDALMMGIYYIYICIIMYIHI